VCHGRFSSGRSIAPIPVPNEGHLLDDLSGAGLMGLIHSIIQKSDRVIYLDVRLLVCRVLVGELIYLDFSAGEGVLFTRYHQVPQDVLLLKSRKRRYLTNSSGILWGTGLVSRGPPPPPTQIIAEIDLAKAMLKVSLQRFESPAASIMSVPSSTLCAPEKGGGGTSMIKGNQGAM